MPYVTVSSSSSNPITFAVIDKADAIRKVSARLLTHFDNKYVENSLNTWLATGMKKGIRIGPANDRFSIEYLE